MTKLRSTNSKTSWGNSKYWKIFIDQNMTTDDIETFIEDYPQIVDWFTKTKQNEMLFLRFDRRINIRSLRYFQYNGKTFKFKKAKPIEWSKKMPNDPSLIDKVCEIIHKEKLTKHDFIEVPMLIKHTANIQKTLALLKETKTTKPIFLNELGPYPIDPTDKKRHFYISGNPNTGKTYFWKKHVGENYSFGPQNNDWRYFDDNKQFVIFDEWTNKTAIDIGVENLNRLMDGECLLNTKGSTIKVKNIHTLIFCSNFKAEFTIPQHLIDPFLTRVNLINF
jgi:hypothetical protein